MVNPFEAVWNTLKTLVDDEPKAPLHVGEVMSCWTYLTVLTQAITYEEIGLNTTTDKEVRELLVDAKKLCESQVKRMNDFLLNEGVPIPSSGDTKPSSEPNEIPLGAKLTDDEIANGISLKTATVAVECAVGNSQSIRSDLGLLWTGFNAELIAFGATTKVLLRKRGWLKIPPYYYPPGMPKE
ncbi:DUF3231 family protein [Virgibacillus flavescens]|uniref:DUF3231 family protein n=1 Tax=Virgibacillus flavescens TaxID=1611422 RepID=UPI003D342E4D